MREDRGDLKAALSPRRVDCPRPHPPRQSSCPGPPTASPRGLTALRRGQVFHDAVPVSNLDGFGVPDGDLAVWPILTDRDGVLLVNDRGGLTPSPGIPCGMTCHSTPLHLPTEQGLHLLPGARLLASLDIESQCPPGAESGAPSQELACLTNATSISDDPPLDIVMAGHPT